MSSKPRAKKSLPEKADSSHKKVKTFELNLTVEELVHLRDIMSVLLPPDGSVTLSQSLANAEQRSMVEAKLWSKLTDICKQASVPLDDHAPDYVVGVTGQPTLKVFQLQTHVNDGESDDDV